MNVATVRTFDFAPLEAVLAGMPSNQVLQALQISGSTLASYRARGLTVTQADRLACRLGYHPSEVWADWGSVAFEDDDELEEIGA